MMRAAATGMLLLVLLAELLAGVAEGYSVKGALSNSIPQQKAEVLVVKKWPKNSKDSPEDDTDDDPDYVPDYESYEDDDEGYDDYYSDEDYDDDYSVEEEDESQEGGGSFIASEETEEGKLWISNKDPTWTPSGNVEDEGYDDDDSQEDDDSHEDYFSQEDDDSQENYYSQQDDDSQEDYFSQEDDDSQENYYSQQDDDSQDDNYGQQDDIQPFPEVTFSQQDRVIPEKDSQQYAQKYISQGYRQAKVKRSAKPYHQAPQQVVQVSAPYGSEQGRIDSGTWGSIQEGNNGYTGVSTGVEPVQPVGGPRQHEVGAGVEPEREGVVDYNEEESSGSGIGRLFREGWNRFTGAVEDLGDRTVDTFTSLGDKVEDAAGTVHDALSGAVDKLHQTYQDLLKRLPQLLERFKALILKFGVVIQEGARYCLYRFNHAYDQVRESQVIEKLENELREGHAEVAQFFQILGEKVQAWRREHGSGHVDAGLLDGYKPVEGQIQQEGGSQREDIEDMPDFFQDDQVIVQLNVLKEAGVLTEDDIIILTQEHVTQNQQNQDQQENQHQQQNQHQHQQNYNYPPSQNTAQFIQFPK